MLFGTKKRAQPAFNKVCEARVGENVTHVVDLIVDIGTDYDVRSKNYRQENNGENE